MGKKPQEVKHDPKIDAWVHAVNKKALDLDEWARSMHPASWLETFQQENEEFRKLAARKIESEN